MKTFGLGLIGLLGLLSGVWADPLKSFSPWLWGTGLNDADVFSSIEVFRATPEVGASVQYDDLYRTGALEKGDASFRKRYEFFWIYPLTRPFPIQTQLDYVRLQTAIQHHADRQRFALRSLTEGLRVKTAFDPKAGWRVVVKSEWIRDFRPSYAVSLKGDADCFGEFGVLYETAAAFSRIEGNVRENAYVLDWSNRMETHGVRWKKTFATLPLEMGIGYQKEGHLRLQEKPSLPTIQPFGYEQRWDLFFQTPLRKRDFGVSGQWRDGRYQAYGKQGELEFAKVTRLKTRLEDYGNWGSFWLSEQHRLGYRVGYTRGSGYVRGHLEFWPFTQGLVDLLGLRRYWIGQFEIKRYQYLLEYQWENVSKKTFQKKMKFNIQFFDVFPKLDLQHWKPIFLVFGKTDEQFYRLKIERLQILQIGLTLEVPYHDLIFAIEGSQMLPIRTQTRTEPSAGDLTQPVQKGTKGKPYGGGAHRLMIRYLFPNRTD